MTRRNFIALLMGLGLIPAAFGAYSLIGISGAEESTMEEFSAADLKRLPAPKEYIGVPVPEGMDMETFDRIVMQALEKASNEVSAPAWARIQALTDALVEQDPHLVEARRKFEKLEEIIREIGEDPDPKVLHQALSARGLTLSDLLETKRRVGEKIGGKLEKEIKRIYEEEGLNNKEFMLRRWDELTRAKLIKLFAEWERSR